MKAGILYAVGMGPGAPDLLTMRAINILREAEVILAAASPRNDYSLGLEIARQFLSPSAEIARLDFPMSKDEALLAKAWHGAAKKTCLYLDRGAKTAFLTLGDPLFYSTFIYLAKEVLKSRPYCRIEIVPGIISFQAAAAKVRMAMGKGNEILKIVPGTLGRQDLQNALAGSAPCVIIKAYRNFTEIVEVLELCDRKKDAVLATFVECENERLSLLEDCDPFAIPPYMSLILCPGKPADSISS